MPCRPSIFLRSRYPRPTRRRSIISQVFRAVYAVDPGQHHGAAKSAVTQPPKRPANQRTFPALSVPICRVSTDAASIAATRVPTLVGVGNLAYAKPYANHDWDWHTRKLRGCAPARRPGGTAEIRCARLSAALAAALARFSARRCRAARPALLPFAFGSSGRYAPSGVPELRSGKWSSGATSDPTPIGSARCDPAARPAPPDSGPLARPWSGTGASPPTLGSIGVRRRAPNAAPPSLSATAERGHVPRPRFAAPR
jgi:hypothetical protein